MQLYWLCSWCWKSTQTEINQACTWEGKWSVKQTKQWQNGIHKTTTETYNCILPTTSILWISELKKLAPLTWGYMLSWSRIHRSQRRIFSRCWRSFGLGALSPRKWAGRSVTQCVDCHYVWCAVSTLNHESSFWLQSLFQVTGGVSLVPLAPEAYKSWDVSARNVAASWSFLQEGSENVPASFRIDWFWGPL